MQDTTTTLARSAAPPRGRGLSAAMQHFLSHEASGGFVLMAAAALALVVANSPLAPTYFALLDVPIGIRAGGFTLEESLLHWINDGLMAVFFLLIGLEIKREILAGQLSTWPQLALPGIAALGGMAVPAVIYAAVNASEPQTLRGWAIPAATDIAFALGVLSLLGRRVPSSLKVFLTALAILDDLGAIVVIALFYTAELHLAALGLAGLGLLALAAMNRFGVTRLAPYVAIGVVIWFFVLESGVHATLAGVAVALTIPLREDSEGPSPLHALEHRLHGWVSFLIVPVFGFANAGLSFAGIGWAALLNPVPLGVALGLFVGKQIGVLGSAWAAIRLFRLADLPDEADWAQLYGVALLCGIGFTMSLFIGALAFGTSPTLIDATKIGVLAGSLLSAVAGYGVLRWAARSRDLPAAALGASPEGQRWPPQQRRPDPGGAR
jgi:NhaA family Na+:H+ antiporter